MLRPTVTDNGAGGIRGQPSETPFNAVTPTAGIGSGDRWD